MNISDLKGYGFNVSEAMELCVDDEEIYKEVLEAALEEGKDKIPLMSSLIENKDYERYIIEAHGLKNAARQIGCDTLSDMAKDSELTGKSGEFESMASKHEELMSEYAKILDILAKFFE